MAQTDLSITNLALLAIEADLITSFNEDSPEAETSKLIYRQVRDEVLGKHDWNFAKTKVRLARLDETPLADWSAVFAMPADYIKNISAGEGSQTRGVDFEIIDGKFHTDSTEMILHYIRRPSERDFPAHFVEVLRCSLEANLIQPLGSGSRAEMMERHQLAEQKLNRAIVIDMRENSARKITGGRGLITARRG